jgi:hypothetical protein
MKHLFKSISAFQGEVKAIHKGTKGYGYSYADLPTIFEAITPLLQKHGLGFMQFLGTKDGANYIETKVFHVESGESISSEVAIPEVSLKGMNDYQSFGSGVTYFRRYALSCALTLVTDVDNDAAGEQTAKKKPVATKPALSDTQFTKALQSIADGKYTADKLKSEFKLTNEQLKQI